MYYVVVRCEIGLYWIGLEHGASGNAAVAHQ
jgi:hypothetical protein